jgi:WD40 repeat protein
MNEDRVFSASDDKTAKTWSISEGECVHTLMGHTGEIYALAVNVQQGLVST